MKVLTKKVLSAVLAAVMLFSLAAALPFSASAAEDVHVLTVKTESNFFPASRNIYTDLSALEDESGDVYITVNFNLFADQRTLVNIDIDKLTWDNTVLEFLPEKNKYGTGRTAVYDIFPFAAENKRGEGTLNFFGTNSGRLTGNYTGVSPVAWAYKEGGLPVTVVRVVFRLIDRTAESTTVTCDLDTLSLCDKSETQPYSKYVPVNAKTVHPEIQQELGFELTSTASPAAQLIPGDVTCSGVLEIQDATDIQTILAEFDTGYDLSDKLTNLRADANGDGVVNVYDVTYVQRVLAGIPVA